MQPIFSVALCGVITVFTLTLSGADQPNDTEDIPNCIESHSCRNKSVICKCDENCAAYGDCCPDSIYINNSIPRQQTTCNKKALLKIQCPPSWKDEAIRYKCENYYELSDPLSTVPVTSSDTTNSYRNYYCAICDGVTQNFVFWTVLVKCPIYHTHDHLSVEYLRNHLQYNPNKDGWGVWLSSDRKVFRKCVFDYQPIVVEEKKIPLRSCLNMVSECPLEWADEDVQKQCNDSFSPVFVGVVAYRNIHCAMCHNVDVKTLSCLLQTTWEDSPPLYGDISKLKPSTPDSINVEFRIESAFCNEGKIYDPFFRKCRHI